MIIVDSSVWIDYFNGQDTLETTILDDALEQDVVAPPSKKDDLIVLNAFSPCSNQLGFITTSCHSVQALHPVL